MRTALNLLRELTEPMPREIFEWNPIQVAERMTATDDFAWNAFAYTYNNYAREGFARSPPAFRQSDFAGTKRSAAAQRAGRNRHRPLQPIAATWKSRLTTHVSSPSGTTQRTLYVNAGGQPSHRARVG